MTVRESRPAAPTLLSLAPSAFLPALIYEIGNGAIAPVIALTATDLGASAPVAALALALLGVGRVIGDVPASALADRIGDRHSMIAAALVAVLASFMCLIAPSLLVLFVALIIIGMSSATFYLARQSYLIDVSPIGLRARALSTLGGSHRIGIFIGPFLGAVAITLIGLRGAYVIAIIAAGTSALVLVLVPDVTAASDQQLAIRGGTGWLEMLKRHRRMFATLGIAIVGIAAVRATRQTVLPLWAEHIGLGAEQTSLIFGISSAVDMALFYPAGKIMDEWGRLVIAIPACVIMGVSMFLVPLSHGAVTLTLAAMLMSFGNGIGSGIMMTLGADAAPIDGRVRFLGVWRFMSDSGNASGPVVVSVATAVAGLAVAIGTIGLIGIVAAGAMAIWVPKYCQFATPAAMRRQREYAAMDTEL